MKSLPSAVEKKTKHRWWSDLLFASSKVDIWYLIAWKLVFAQLLNMFQNASASWTFRRGRSLHSSIVLSELVLLVSVLSLLVLVDIKIIMEQQD